MGLDPLSPIAPARVRALLLPLGKIRRARFSSFVDRLSPENVVRLGDISPDARPNRNMFSPLAFPSGMIVYDLSTSYPPATSLALSPFELYREPLAIIAIADGTELSLSVKRGQNGSAKGTRPTSYHNYVRELDQELEAVRDQFPKALIHHLLIFDYESPPGGASLPDGLSGIPPAAECRSTTIKTAMCDISSLLLAELTTLAKSIQGKSTIESPNQARAISQDNGYSWSHEEASTRRNSQISLGERNESPGVKPDRSAVRMSMPALRRRRSDMSRSNSESRPTTPSNNQSIPEATSPENGPVSRAKNEAFRDHSRDRISIQGFGSGSTSEMSRNKGKARVGIIMSSLYLMAGRWPDSMRELVEAATLAKAGGDHLWHAKALELITVNMFMLAWVGMDFSVPQICYATAEKAALQPPASTSEQGLASNRLASLSSLSALLPELLAKILHLYERSANRVGESLPQSAFSESAIRFSKALAAVHLAGGKLNDEALQLMVNGTPFAAKPNTRAPRLYIQPARASILAVLFKAFPSTAAVKDLPVIDRTVILGGIASVLGELGYHRKKAMVMRELVAAMMPGLIQARLAGAAEMGIHPSAGSAALNGVNGLSGAFASTTLGSDDIEAGVDQLLCLLGEIYGTVSWSPPLKAQKVKKTGNDDTNDAILDRIMRNTRLRAFGGQNMKMNILRASIDLLEALPDHRAILRFTSDLLRTAGSGIAPGPTSLNASPIMTREEQLRLATTIRKYVAAGRKLGLRDIAAEYWDEFLVRGVELEPQPQSRAAIPHQASDVNGTSVSESKERNPFIHNPFSRRPEATAERLLVAGEAASFKVTLQNPYEIDLEIESIRLEAEGVDFTSAVQNTVIGTYRTQILTVGGTPTAEGTLKITGCIIKIRDCRERRFPIFTEPWSPKSELRIKSIGLSASEIQVDVPRPVSVGQKPPQPEVIPPIIATSSVTVIPKQPVIVVKSTTLSQSAIMVLEGERLRFSVTLANLSPTATADLLLFSFHDSTQGPLQLALSNRDATPAELYEYELILLKKAALRWIPGDSPPSIAPGSTSTFDFEILGKPGLTNCAIQVDYASLNKPASEVSEKFYTRQVTLPLTVTVNAGLELAKLDILPLSGKIPEGLWPGDKINDLKSEDFCLLMLDVRNAWPSALHVQLDMGNDRKVDEDILPGNTSRLLFPFRRIALEDPHAAIPTLDPSRQRQFVVSTGRVTADSERAMREGFWYKEAILKSLNGSWSTVTGPKRRGDIEFRGLRLVPRAIEAIKVDEVDIDISIDGNAPELMNQITVETFRQVQVRVTNKTAKAIDLVLRIQPSLRHQTHSHALDLHKKLVWDGTLQSTIPTVPAHESVEVSVGVCALCRGEFEISASVEEVRLVEAPKEKGDQSQSRPRANTKTMMDALLGSKDRRIWHSRTPFVLVVRDVEGEA